MMKQYIKYAWYAFVLLWASVFLARIGPRFFEAAHYQFFDPNGGPSMWPATFEGFLILFSIPSAALALILCLREKGNRAYRLASGLLGTISLVLWFYGAALWTQSSSSIFRASLVEEMIDNDGAHFLLVGVVLHLVFAFSGCGIAVWFNRLFARLKRKSDPVGGGDR